MAAGPTNQVGGGLKRLFFLQLFLLQLPSPSLTPCGRQITDDPFAPDYPLISASSVPVRAPRWGPGDTRSSMCSFLYIARSHPTLTRALCPLTLL